MASPRDYFEVPIDAIEVTVVKVVSGGRLAECTEGRQVEHFFYGPRGGGDL